MVDLKATNEKLKDRAQRIVSELTGLPKQKAKALLTKADNETKTAIVMHHKKTTAPRARRLLKQNQNSLRQTLQD
jgi:N-acetylmuramic acid 6-phosphate etherase